MKDTEPVIDGDWTTALGVLLVLAIFIAIALVAGAGWPWFQKFLEGSAAAWIQAVGSITAILAAASIGRSQIAAQRQIELTRQAQENRKKLLVIDALLEAIEVAVTLTKKQHDNYPAMPVFAHHLDRIGTAANALAKIDLFSCPPSVIQPLLHLFPAPCENLLSAIQRFNESFDKLDENYKTFSPVVSNAFTIQELFLINARTACHSALQVGS